VLCVAEISPAVANKAQPVQGIRVFCGPLEHLSVDKLGSVEVSLF
jgi:hypothetical protein